MSNGIGLFVDGQQLHARGSDDRPAVRCHEIGDEHIVVVLLGVEEEHSTVLRKTRMKRHPQQALLDAARFDLRT